MRVLIAEDELAVRELLSRALVQDGHTVEAAENGALALEELSGEATFDILLTDIRMPVMDGIALALAAARDHPYLAIVLMTGYAGEQERARGLETLVQAVLLKPFGLDEIRATLSAATTAKRTAH